MEERKMIFHPLDNRAGRRFDFASSATDSERVQARIAGFKSLSSTHVINSLVLVRLAGCCEPLWPLLLFEFCLCCGESLRRQQEGRRRRRRRPSEIKRRDDFADLVASQEDSPVAAGRKSSRTYLTDLRLGTSAISYDLLCKM